MAETEMYVRCCLGLQVDRTVGKRKEDWSYNYSVQYDSE